MPALASTSRAIARTWTQHSLPVARAGCTAMQTRNASDAPASFNSPFKGAESTTRIPSFGAYRNKAKGEMGPKMMQYFMVGTMGALASLGAKATVQGRFTLHASRELRTSLELGLRVYTGLRESNWLFCGRLGGVSR
jgi:hypothetical protein